jgi:hypothetical protein
MALIDEINEQGKNIQADCYSISIGEIISMYKEGDLDIHPEFQRFYRWTEYQKTRLIESLLLNIPVPPIFVSQREDGVWDVVDGLQRLSTIFEFVGIYKDEDGNKREPLVLKGTKMLPSLEGKKFQDDTDIDNSFTDAERRYLKRAKISLNILLKNSDGSSKYELFQRLNTGGSALSDQEVRNCLMVMTDKNKFAIIQRMSQNKNFQSTLRINERMKLERYDMELATRFLCLRSEKNDNLNKIKDFGEYLNERTLLLFNDSNLDWDEEEDIFIRTFEQLDSQMHDDVFCRYNPNEDKFRGGFSIAAFEVIAIGLGRRSGKIPEGYNLMNNIKNLWHSIDNGDVSWRGYSAAGRLLKTLSLADSFYENQE